MGAARKGSETSWGALDKAQRFWLSKRARHARERVLPLYPKFNAAQNRCGSRPRIRNSRGAGRFWSSSGAGRTRVGLDGFGRRLELGAPGVGLFPRGALEKARRVCSSIGSVRARGRALPAETVGELLKRLDSFGRQLELGASGVGLSCPESVREPPEKILVVNWSWAHQG